MRFFEYRSSHIVSDDYETKLQDTLNMWSKEGWEVLSVIVPQLGNYSTYVVTAKREIISQRTLIGRRFR